MSSPRRPGAPERPGRFALVGHGWRADFFLRVASRCPDFFHCAGAVTRTAAAGAELEREWGIPTYRSIEELVAEQEIDVAVVSIPRAEAPAVIVQLVELGIRVLSETPPAPDVDSLRSLWSAVGHSDLVRIAEQTPYLPVFQAAREIISTGVLGVVSSAALSWTHDYHAMAVLRQTLGFGGEGLTITASATTEPLLDAADPRVALTPLEVTDHLHTRALVQSATATGLYDFVANQWYNPLRRRRFLARGSTGELDERGLIWSGADGTPMTAQIERRQLGVDGNLEGADLDVLTWADRVVYRNPFAGGRLSDDEIAVGTCLLLALQDERMGGHSLADACQDQYLALAVQKAVADGEPVVTEVQPWGDRLDLRSTTP
jgi:predicted dehydrogenase